jgi:hypothetical protein
MSLMKLTLKKSTVLLIVLCFIMGFAIAYRIFVVPNSSSNPWIILKTEDGSKKFISKETLVSSIRQRQKLITTEVELNERMTADSRWGDWDIFKKIQNINFVGTGLYSVDLSNLSIKNIDINNKTVTITLPSPAIEMVTTNPDKTSYEKTDNGIFRFGEIKLSTEDQQLLQKTVESKMRDKMLEKQYYDTAIGNSEKSMISLIKSIVNTTNFSYIIKIKFSQSKKDYSA